MLCLYRGLIVIIGSVLFGKDRKFSIEITSPGNAMSVCKGSYTHTSIKPLDDAISIKNFLFYQSPLLAEATIIYCFFACVNSTEISLKTNE
jgi:hypothetical protein